MDRSFLSDNSVIAASRAFICIRLSTYESAEEATVLKSLFIGRSGELENTTFAILAADGKTRLGRAGRSPDFMFRDAADMARGLNEIAAKQIHGAESRSASQRALPRMADARLALNVAACDSLPLVLARAATPAALSALEEKVRAFAWKDGLAGRFIYVGVVNTEKLPPITGLDASSVIAVIEPDTFGLKGTVAAQAGAAATADALQKLVTDACAKHHATTKDTRSHIRAAHEAGANWDTKIPVTDPGPKGGGPGTGGPPGGPPRD